MIRSLWLLLCSFCRRLVRCDWGLVDGAKRSGKWPKVRAAHLRRHPACAVTGDTSDVEVHHIVPFDKEPSLELEPSNLITLSNKAVSVHLLFGHLGRFQCVNPFVREDAAVMHLKVKHRDAIEKAAALLAHKQAKGADRKSSKRQAKRNGRKHAPSV